LFDRGQLIRLLATRLLSKDGQKIELDQDPFLASILHRDRAARVRGAHFAGGEIQVVPMFSKKPDGLRAVILDVEVAGRQPLREKGHTPWLDPLGPVPSATL